MRFLTCRPLFMESLEIGATLGSMPPSHLRPTIENETSVELESCRVFGCADQVLLLADESASWCLLEEGEAAVALSAQGQTFGQLSTARPELDPALLREFFVRLYQRGLLRLNDEPGFDPRLLEDGAIFHDANLVEILVTQKCNLACLYCLAEAGPDMPHLHPEIAFEAVDRAFELPEAKPLAIQLSGGEPFVNFKLFRAVVEYIERKSAETGREAMVCTQSNGTLVTDEIAEFLAAHGIAIGVSIDGPAHLNNRSRPMLGGQESHARTIRGIKILQQRGIKFGTILVLNRVNVGYPEEIADFFSELGIKSTKINPINMIGDAQRTWDDMSISSDEYFEFLDRWIAHVTNGGPPVLESNLGEYLKYLYRRVHDYRCMRSNCGAGKSFFLVDASGDVYPCAHSAGIPEWKLGSVADAATGGFEALGTSHPVLVNFRRRFVDLMDDSRPCPWRHFCEGGCAVNAYQKFGTVVATDTLCAFYERIYPRLLELLAAEPERFQRLLDITLGPGQARVGSLDFGIPTNSDGLVRKEALNTNYHARCGSHSVNQPASSPAFTNGRS